jgi:hypothetical protein
VQHNQLMAKRDDLGRHCCVSSNRKKGTDHHIRSNMAGEG